MEPMGLFNQTFSVLEKSLNLRSEKHSLLVSNISNMDTPNFKAFDVMVKKEMQKADQKDGKLNLFQTQPMHFALPELSNGEHPEVIQVEEPQYNFREDGNTVDIDKTMTEMSENGLLYNASAEMITKKFQSLSKAISGTVG